MNQEQAAKEWDLIISSRHSFFSLNLREVWRYRDLLFLFVKRDFIAQYKQTILGPLWHFINPIFTTLTFTIIFGNVAKLSTDGTPQLVFYMSGITIWNYFSSTLTSTGSTFLSNAGIFGKVYFPRLISPLSTLFSNTIKFGIQLLILTGFVGYYCYKGQLGNFDSVNLLFLPVVAVLVGLMGLGFGVILSSVTTKYRDLNVLLGFGINLLMYATPVIYPLSTVPEKYRLLLEWNPLSPLVEWFRYIFTGVGTFTSFSLAYSTLFVTVIVIIGMFTFNKVEKTFMDTV
jgi:lipopolysaccharide transport system permease protein